MFKPKLPQQDQGFLLVEVLAALLIASMFITIAMQIMAIAALLKARAQEYTEAISWIREDLEKVKYEAVNFRFANTSLTSDANVGDNLINVALAEGFVVNDTLRVGSDSGTYRITGISGNRLNITPRLTTAQSLPAVVTADNYTSLTADANRRDSSINVASVNGLVVNDKLKVGSDSTTYTITSISGTTLNITPTLSSDRLQGVPVIKTTMCDPPYRETNAGFAAALRQEIVDNNTTTPDRIVGDLSITDYSEFFPRISNLTRKPFHMRRTATLPLLDSRPYNVLKLEYEVLPDDGSRSVASSYTEVIPNVALQCP